MNNKEFSCEYWLAQKKQLEDAINAIHLLVELSNNDNVPLHERPPYKEAAILLANRINSWVHTVAMYKKEKL